MTMTMVNLKVVNLWSSVQLGMSYLLGPRQDHKHCQIFPWRTPAMAIILWAFLYILGGNTLLYLPSLLHGRTWKEDAEEAWWSFDQWQTPEQNLGTHRMKHVWSQSQSQSVICCRLALMANGSIYMYIYIYIFFNAYIFETQWHHGHSQCHSRHSQSVICCLLPLCWIRRYGHQLEIVRRWHRRNIPNGLGFFRIAVQAWKLWTDTWGDSLTFGSNSQNFDWFVCDQLVTMTFIDCDYIAKAIGTIINPLLETLATDSLNSLSRLTTEAQGSLQKKWDPAPTPGSTPASSNRWRRDHWWWCGWWGGRPSGWGWQFLENWKEVTCGIQWADLRENLQETIDFPLKCWIFLEIFP